MTAEEKSRSTEQIVSIYRWITVDSLLVMRLGASFYTKTSLTLFSSLFPYLSPPLLIFSFENRPASSPGRMSSNATKPGFSFFVFILCYSTLFWLVNACFCCVRFSFFHTKPWGHVSEMTYFVSSGTENQNSTILRRPGNGSVTCWCNGQRAGLATQLTVAGSTPGLALSGNNLGQVVHTRVHLPACSITKEANSQNLLRPCHVILRKKLIWN